MTPPDRIPLSLWDSPLAFIVRHLYALSVLGHSGAPVVSQARDDSIRIVAISDTHSAQDQLPPLPSGDILIHAGDLTQTGTHEEIDAALGWLASQPHQYKIFIAGNHDVGLGDPKMQAHYAQKYPGLIYLQDSAIIISVRGRALRVYGNAQTPAHRGCMTFTYPRISPALPYSPDFGSTPEGSLWAHVPTHADVTVTHGPPRHLCDEGGKGCAGLTRELWRVRPLLHVCGHIHTAHGTQRVRWTPAQAAYERAVDGAGSWTDLFPIAWAVIGRVWEALNSLSSGERERGCETIVANVASRNRKGDGILRNAEVFDI